MKKSILVIVLVLAGRSLFAQQQAQFSQYMINTNAVNPAYTGSRGALSTLLLHRSQWVGFDGAPVSQTLNVNTPLFDEKMGVGLTLLNDKIGPTRQAGIYGDYAYRINFEKSSLAFGIKAGADVFRVGFNNLVLINQQDNNFQQNLQSKLLPNFGFGVYYHSDKFYLGLSTPKLVQNTVSVKTGNSTTVHLAIEKMHHYVIAGYVHEISPMFKFMPTALLRVTRGAPVSFDVSTSFIFYDKLWLGAMYRLNAAIGTMIQLQLNEQFRAGYAFDYTTSMLQSYHSGTHELFIGYDLKYTKAQVKSPRYF